MRSSCDFGEVLRRQLEELELVVKESPASKGVNMEDVIRRQPVKI
jgi:hypothetical protein